MSESGQLSNGYYTIPVWGSFKIPLAGSSQNRPNLCCQWARSQVGKSIILKGLAFLTYVPKTWKLSPTRKVGNPSNSGELSHMPSDSARPVQLARLGYS